MIEQFKTNIEEKKSNVKSILKNKQTYLEEIKLNPYEQTVIERSKCFAFNYRPKEGIFIYATKNIKDKDLFDFLLTVVEENIAKFSITNAQLSDAGIAILSEFFSMKNNLHVLKLYNNLMYAIQNNIDVPYLLTGTAALTKCFYHNQTLVTLELHGFFFHQPDFPFFIDALRNCKNLKRL